MEGEDLCPFPAPETHLICKLAREKAESDFARWAHSGSLLMSERRAAEANIVRVVVFP